MEHSPLAVGGSPTVGSKWGGDASRNLAGALGQMHMCQVISCVRWRRKGHVFSYRLTVAQPFLRAQCLNTIL